MGAQNRYQAVLEYLTQDETCGGIPLGNFRLTWHLFTMLLDILRYGVTEEALTKLAFYLDDEQRQWLKQLAEQANRLDDASTIQTISEEIYQAQKEPRFGQRNPELFNLLFWQLMIRRGWPAYSARKQFDRQYQQYTDYIQRWSDEPLPDSAATDETHAADIEQSLPEHPNYDYGGAVWSFARFGMSSTTMPDGREIYIAGEHEDFYDPDFYIYNDVIVIHPNLAIDIYGYPQQVFAPTDFHSATLVGDNTIYIIGSLGYLGTREPGETPVYRLNCQNFQIEKVPTTGDKPGWIHGHTAQFIAKSNAIKVTHGEVFVGWDRKRQLRKNRKIYWLDVTTNRWSCSTNVSAA